MSDWGAPLASKAGDRVVVAENAGADAEKDPRCAERRLRQAQRILQIESGRRGSGQAAARGGDVDCDRFITVTWVPTWAPGRRISIPELNMSNDDRRAVVVNTEEGCGNHATFSCFRKASR